MIRKYLLFIQLLILVPCTFSQEKEIIPFKKNGIYTEVYILRHDFNGGYVSLNYERAFGRKRNMNLRAGIYPDFRTVICLPITMTWITGARSKHHFEGGVGTVFRIEHYVDPYGMNSKEWFYDMPAVMIPIMYRFQGSKGLYFRIGANLFVSYPILPSPSASLGYRFGSAEK